MSAGSSNIKIWVISTIFYVCSCNSWGISSVVCGDLLFMSSLVIPDRGRSFNWYQFGTGLGLVGKSIEFLIFNMGLRIRVRVSRALYFDWGSYVFLVTSEPLRSPTFKLSAVCFLLSDPVFVIKLPSYLPFHSRVTYLAFIRLYILY